MTTDRRAFLGASAAAAAAGLASIPGQAAQQPQPPQQPVPPPGQPALQQPPQDSSTLGRTAHTRFAVNLEMWWTNLPFLRRIEETARLGYRAIEFWPWRGKDIPAVAAACQRLNLEVAQFSAWGFRPGLNDPANHNHFEQEIRASLETARRLNCRLMCVVAGDDVPGMTQQQMHQHVITGLNRVKRMVEDAGVTLILEPMNIRVDHRGHCLYGFEPARRIINAVNSRNVKILWDLYHMQITEGDLCGHLRDAFRDNLVAYLQIADHPGRNEPGTGEVHYNRVLKQLHDLGYRGYVGLEFRPRTDGVAAARATWSADQW